MKTFTIELTEEECKFVEFYLGNDSANDKMIHAIWAKIEVAKNQNTKLKIKDWIMGNFIAVYMIGCVVAGLLVSNSIRVQLENHILDTASDKDFSFPKVMVLVILLNSIFWPWLLIQLFLSLKDKENA